ncbi:glutathione S-transferase family protein [Acidimangrovimonas sediminis]|uniref:glutathione S-transferase family protein n=1 Tax=Acidimangrovimonas sediminis TaxID=2056283 RepID=UPI001E33084F|nr:glutathione S-transferase family protein [Acidimangrovimonas sediminis]
MADPIHTPSPDMPPRMTLRSSLTSPYGRKVRIALHELGLHGQVEVIHADTLDPEDDLRRQNPLGKMPCLIVGGETLYDSRTILEYLDALAGGGRLCPRAGTERFRVLTQAVLADGITDAGLLMVYERRFRDEAKVSDRWLSHQRGKVERALSVIQAAPPDPGRTDIASISLACALGYLDWRRPVDWRPAFPGVVRWLDAFAAAEPAFSATARPPETS